MFYQLTTTLNLSYDEIFFNTTIQRKKYIFDSTESILEGRNFGTFIIQFRKGVNPSVCNIEKCSTYFRNFEVFTKFFSIMHEWVNKEV